MCDKGEKTCPLCAEEMDLTDQQLKPCKCGYEICVWCWHHIMEMAEKDNTECRCPAYRSTYDKEKIVGMAANCERLVAEINSEWKQKTHKTKPKVSEGRMHLSNIRVIKRNLVYIIGLPLDLADEDLLQRREYFGQYGKVLKVLISKTANGVIQHSSNNSCCVYVTYSKEEEAVCCIQSVHSFVLEGRPLSACFGTTKYCHAWLRNVPCNIPDCLYLHDFGSQEDSFSKDEIVSAFSRSRVQQTIGASNNLHRRSGNLLPPPVAECISSSILSSAKPVAKSSNNIGNQSRESCVDGGTGNSSVLPSAASWVMRVSASLSPVPNMSGSQGTFSNNKPDAFAGPHVSSEVVNTKQSTHDVWKSVTAEETSEIHPNCGTEFSEEYPDSDYQARIENRKLDTLSNMTSAPVTCGDCILAPINIKSSINYCPESSHTSGSDDENINIDGDFQDLSSICTLGHTENEEPAPIIANISVPTHTSFSVPRCLSFQEDIGEQNVYAPSLPLQSRSMTTEDLLDLDDQQLKGLGNICNLPSASCSISLQQSLNKSSNNSWQQVSKPPASVPPGFSAPSKAAPPGFSTSGIMHLALDSAASHLLQTSEPQIKNIGCSGDVEFVDPAIREVGKGVMVTGYNKPGFGTRTSAQLQSSFDHDARLQLLMQQSLYAHQSLLFQDHSWNRISQPDDAYSRSPMLLGQSPAYNPFSFPQSTIQQLRHAHMSNYHRGSWNEDRGFNDLRLQELLKNEGLGFNKLTPSFEDLRCQVSSSSNLYNRGFAM